jgi:hypothetical protein
MTARETGALLLVVGSLIFLAGAALGVPRVFTERDREKRLQMLTERLTAWRAAQPLYALGPLVAATGVGVVAAGTRTPPSAQSCRSRAWLSESARSREAGPSTCTGRESRTSRSAGCPDGRLPSTCSSRSAGFSFSGPVSSSAAFLRGLVGSRVAANLVFLAAYLRFGDLPPFVFYLLLILVGIAIR